MHVVDRLELAAGLAGLAQKLVVGRLADQRLLDLGGAHRRHADAAERHRRARDLAGAILGQQRRRRDDGEVAVPAREFDEAVAVAVRPEREAHGGHQLVQLDRRRHEGDREGGELDLARAVRPLHRHGRIHRGGDGHEFGRRIEMAERAAERAAVAGLAVADMQDRLVHQRAALAHHVGEFDVALARHGADLERAVGLADVGRGRRPC